MVIEIIFEIVVPLKYLNTSSRTLEMHSIYKSPANLVSESLQHQLNRRRYIRNNEYKTLCSTSNSVDSRQYKTTATTIKFRIQKNNQME